MSVLLHLGDRDDGQWAERLRAELGEDPVVRRGEPHDPAAIDYIVVWRPAPGVFEPLINLKAVLSIGAGVDGLLASPDLPDVPIVRFVDPVLSQSMCDYVVAHATMHLRQFTRFAAEQERRAWSPRPPQPASEISVGVMGLGEIGRLALSRLGQIGFTVAGWSRTRRHIEGARTFWGHEGLDAFLGGTDILVNLLALTPQTEGILCADTFGKLRRGTLEGGPVIINAARGGHQREADIVRALSEGTLGAASLDVFETEPLPPTSPLWALPNCYITPHVAGRSDEISGARTLARIIRDHRAGRPLPHLVERSRGY